MIKVSLGLHSSINIPQGLCHYASGQQSLKVQNQKHPPGIVLQNRFLARKTRFLSNNAGYSPASLLKMNYFTDFHKVFRLQLSKLQDVQKTSSRRFFKTFQRHLKHILFQTLEGVFSKTLLGVFQKSQQDLSQCYACSRCIALNCCFIGDLLCLEAKITTNLISPKIIVKSAARSVFEYL